MIRTWKTWLMGAAVVLTVGCHNWQRRPAPPPMVVPAPRPVVMPPPGAVITPPPGAVITPPPGAVITPPPGAVITPPPGSRVMPPPGGVIPPADPLPGGKAPPGPDAARVDFRWTPAPETRTTPKGPASSVLLFPPEISDHDPPKTPARRPSTPLPVGIAGFAAVRDKVDAGQRPSLDEGLDWLAANGYKTILHVRAPGEADSDDRKQVEKRGMKYESLEISPKDLNREAVDAFLGIVKDSGVRPLFVYDRDGTLLGGLWYLYFRIVEETPDDVARVRAGSLGLRESGEMWEAARKLVP